MKNLKAFGLGILACAFFFSACLAYAQPIRSGELIDKASAYDGQTVTYAGEVIGDIMLRGDYAWVNINDADNAIGVWLPRAAAVRIIRGGTYKSKGDWIEVSGVFRRACPQHGGDLDIHAEAVRIIAPGKPLGERLDVNKRNMAITLVVCICLVLISRRLKTA
ncbi:MAG TPA: DNA-binding protein [Patescibacteria group bacterium]|nr:DNA-binding protein [Patescibacteria group bacterium]